MGSRIFFYFLPSKKKLDFCAVVRTLVDGGLSFDSEAYINTFNEDFDLISATERVVDKNSGGIYKILKEEEYVDIEFGDRNIFGTASFGSPHISPIFALIVPTKNWAEVSPINVRSTYEPLFIEVATQAGAGAIIKVVDAFDDFFLSIIYVDGTWVFDMEFPTPLVISGHTFTSYARSTVWSDTSEQLPMMRNLEATGRKVGRFEEFREQ